MSRAEFTKATKLLAFRNSGGRCQQCTARLGPGNTEYHHDKECTFGGSSDLANCIVLCRACHRIITSFQAALIAKSNRIRERHLGIKRKSSRPMPGSKASGRRKKFNGTVERRA